MAEEVLEFTLEVNGVQQAITSVEELEEAVVQLQDQLNKGDLGAEQLQELNTNLDKAKTKLEAMKQATKDAGDSAKKEGVDGAKAIGLFRESFDGAANAAEVLAGENEALGKVVMTVMKGIAAVNSAREVTENKVTIAVIRRQIAEKAAAAGTAILNTINKALNITLKANPIGLLVTAVVLLATGILALINPIKKAIEQFDFLNDAIQAVADGVRNVLSFLSGGLIDDAATAKTKDNAQKVLDSYDAVDSAANKNINTIQNRLKILQAEGASEKKIYDTKIQLLNAEVKKRQEAIAAIVALGADATEEQLKQLATLRKEVGDAQTDIKVETLNFNKSQEDARQKAADKAAEQAKAAADKRKAERERIAALEKGAQEKLLALQQQYTLDSIKNDEERALKALEFAKQKTDAEIAELKKQGASAATVQALTLAADTKYQQDKTKIQDEGQKKREEQQKAYDEKLLALQNEYTTLSIEDEQARAEKELEIQKQADLKSIEETQFTEEQKTALKLQYEQNYQLKLAELKDAAAAAQREKDYALFQEQIALTEEFNTLSLGKQRELAEQKNAEFAALLLNEKLTAEERKQIEKDYADFQKTTADQIAANRASALDAVQGAIQNVASLVGEQTKAGKALAVADAIINTYKGASQAIGAAPPPFNFILAASVVGAGLANVRKILTTQVPAPPAAGGGGGGGTQPQKFARGGVLNGPSHAMGGIQTAYGELEGGEYVVNKRSTQMYAGVISAINQIGGGRKYADGGMLGMETVSQLNDLENKLNAPPAVKTYVVATDVSDAQQADFAINNLSRL